MPTTHPMTYNATQKRWFKQYKTRTYSVSCKQLGCPPNRAGSALAAANWWTTKQAELDAAERVAAEQAEAALTAASDFDRITAEGVTAADRRVREAAQTILGREVPEGVNINDWIDSLECDPSYQCHPRRFAFLSAAHGETPPTVRIDRTANAQVALWLEQLSASVTVGGMDISRYESYRRDIRPFTSWFRADRAERDVADITAAVLDEWFAHLVRQIRENRYSPATASKLLMTSKQFITWLGERSVIPLPANIRAKRHRITIPAKAPERWSLDEVREALQVAGEVSSRTKLFLLLMLNCGMLQADISDLGVNEVDWTAGTIRRARSKRPTDKTPRATYPLWAPTFELLKQHRTTHRVLNERGSFRVLATDEGTALCGYRADGDDVRRKDGVSAAIQKIMTKLSFRHPIKTLRKTAAAILESHPTHNRFVPYFLAHSPKQISERHYAAPDDKLFAEAVAWLGEQVLGKPETPATPAND